MAISLNCLNTYWFSQASNCCSDVQPGVVQPGHVLGGVYLPTADPAAGFVVLLLFFNAPLMNRSHALALAADGEDRPEGRQAQDQGGVITASWLLFQHGQGQLH